MTLAGSVGRMTLGKALKAKPSKYRNVPTTTPDGIRHPSKKQAKRWQELLLMEKAGKICELEREVTFRLDVDGIKICSYRADHCYLDDGVPIVEDVKGKRTAIYLIKRRLMLACHGITIREV